MDSSSSTISPINRLSPFNPQLKLMAHSGLLDDWRKPPVSVEISPTNFCNAKCPWCFYVSGTYKQRHSREELEHRQLEILILDLARMGVQSITWTGGGEPSIYSQMAEMIDLAHGVRTPARDVHKWVCAVEESRTLGLDQGNYRDGKIHAHKAHVRLEYVAVTDTGVNFNVTRDNSGQLERMLNEAIELGVKYFQFRPALADQLGSAIGSPLPGMDRKTTAKAVGKRESKSWPRITNGPTTRNRTGTRSATAIGLCRSSGMTGMWLCVHIHHGKSQFTFGNLQRADL